MTSHGHAIKVQRTRRFQCRAGSRDGPQPFKYPASASRKRASKQTTHSTNLDPKCRRENPRTASRQGILGRCHGSFLQQQFQITAVQLRSIQPTAQRPIASSQVRCSRDNQRSRKARQARRQPASSLTPHPSPPTHVTPPPHLRPEVVLRHLLDRSRPLDVQAEEVPAVVSVSVAWPPTPKTGSVNLCREIDDSFRHVRRQQPTHIEASTRTNDWTFTLWIATKNAPDTN